MVYLKRVLICLDAGSMKIKMVSDGFKLMLYIYFCAYSFFKWYTVYSEMRCYPLSFLSAITAVIRLLSVFFMPLAYSMFVLCSRFVGNIAGHKRKSCAGICGSVGETHRLSGLRSRCALRLAKKSAGRVSGLHQKSLGQVLRQA